MVQKRATCLLGNGLSVAYNNDLSVAQLTIDIQAAFSDLGGTAAEDALRALASTVRGTAADNFEQLLGPLDTVSAVLPQLDRLAAVSDRTSDGSVHDAVRVLTGFTEDVHRIGLGITLEMIARRSVEVGGGHFDTTVKKVVADLLGFGFEEPLTIATLSYDTLVLAALIEECDNRRLQLSDLGSGLPSQKKLRSISTKRTGESLARSLRRDDDFIGEVQLIHLHGSLGWLGEPDGSDAYKFDIESLRSDRGWPDYYWTHFQNGDAVLRPVLVLTDRKNEAVITWPFSLAYATFEARLAASSHWMIGGYGFGDDPVNAALRRARKARLEAGLSDPILFVIGTGTKRAIKGRVLSAIGTAPDYVDTAGFPDASAGAPAAAWLAESP